MKDLNRGISGIVYDKLGHPTQVTFTSGNTISYVYAADGRKLRAVHRQGTYQPVTTDYAGPYEFTGGTISRVSFPGGYYSYSPNGWTSHYYIQDYQGSNRKVVNAASTAVEQVTHYYPYGGVIGDISTPEGTQKYKFEGKELDRSFGLDNYDIHARNYFAMLPMWDRVDPLAEKYYGISPYVYCGGDPVNNMDVDGMKITISPCPNGLWEKFMVSLCGDIYTTSYQQKVQDAIVLAKGLDSDLKQMINTLEESNLEFTITANSNNSFSPENKSPESPIGGTVNFNSELTRTKLGEPRPSVVALVHELGHASDYNQGKQDGNHRLVYDKDGKVGITGMSEITAFKYENLIRKALHLKQRTEYGGVPLSDYETMKTEDVERKYQQQKK